MPLSFSRFIGLAAVALLAAGIAAADAQSPPRQLTFRSGTDLIPVDIRVLDKKGLPVTDLKLEDFTVYENGVKQPIRHFSTQPLTPAVPDRDALHRVTNEAWTMAAQNRRLFLIVLGRGRLQGPSKGMDALLTFVRERLMPQDLVAVMAWNRATDFSTDHEQAATLIDRFRTRHEAIETELAAFYSGLAGLYAGGRPIPQPIQAMVDDVFRLPGAAAREVVPTGATAPAETAIRQQAAQLLERTAHEAFRLFSPNDRAIADLMASDTTLGQNFDQYISMSRETLQDVGNLYAGVDYLRFLDGEKHLLFVTEQGFLLPSGNDDHDLGSFASDARVVLDMFQVGGVATEMSGGFPVVSRPNGFALSSLVKVADLSGGQAAVSEHGLNAIDRIARATEFGYLLGYTPADRALDGRFRTIRVEVARKNVTVAYRHGYFARPPAPFDPRKTISTTRIVAAANYGEEIRDLRLSVKVSDATVGVTRSVVVDTIVSADRLVFARTADGYLAALTQVVYCENGSTVVEQWRTLNLTIPPDQIDEVRRSGLKVSATVPVPKRPGWVRVIVYDYGSDLLGSTRIRRD